MDPELKKQLNSIQSQLGELTPLVPEEMPTRREVNELRARLEIVEQKLGIR
jgi:hypothetical protein